MPVMNGLDAAREMTDRFPKIQILLLSVFLSKQLSDEARAVGVRATCAKADISRVIDAIHALLRRETYFCSPDTRSAA
jgi:DNA-binding NarL/FixJ family response regulator